MQYYWRNKNQFYIFFSLSIFIHGAFSRCRKNVERPKGAGLECKIHGKKRRKEIKGKKRLKKSEFESKDLNRLGSKAMRLKKSGTISRRVVRNTKDALLASAQIRLSGSIY